MSVILLVIVDHISAQTTLAYNKDFELIKKGSSVWQINELDAAKIIYTDAIKSNGKYSLLIDGRQSAIVADYFDASYFEADFPENFLTKHKLIRIEAKVKTDSYKDRGGIWFVQIHGNDKPQMQMILADTIKDQSGWQQLRLETKLDPGATFSGFGGTLNGPGKVWFDEFRVFVDGKEIKDIAALIPEPSGAEIASLNKAVVPLQLSDSGKEMKGFEKLSGRFGNTRITGAGEPTHGTREASLYKIALFKWLVQNKGYNTFMLEDELPEAAVMNDCLMNGGDSATALLKKYFFPVWRTEEMAGLLQWIANYNKLHVKKLQFCGMDMQSARIAYPTLKRLSVADEQLHDLVIRFSKAYDSIRITKDPLLKKIYQEQTRTFLVDLMLFKKNNEFMLYKLMPPDSVHQLMFAIDIMQQNFNANNGTFRDSCMAKNIIEYSRFNPEAKIFIWAHNSHVSKQKNWMGAILADHFGNEYYTIAAATAKGKYTASRDFAKTFWSAWPLEDTYPGTYEYYFEKAAAPDFILPLHAVADNPGLKWLADEKDFRSIGFMQMKEQFNKSRLTHNFDAVIFFRNSSNTRSYMIKN
ncbi:MAG: erythromycin esterase family protein [Ferruginibacter sp.]